MPVSFPSDYFSLKFVFSSLVDNAIKYSGSDRKSIRVSATSNERGVTVCVADEGIGIDPKLKDQVFALFKRGAQDIEGSGVGLAYVKMLVEKLGGHIWFENNTDRPGVAFFVFLPEE